MIQGRTVQVLVYGYLNQQLSTHILKAFRFGASIRYCLKTLHCGLAEFLRVVLVVSGTGIVILRFDRIQLVYDFGLLPEGVDRRCLGDCALILKVVVSHAWYFEELAIDVGV